MASPTDSGLASIVKSRIKRQFGGDGALTASDIAYSETTSIADEIRALYLYGDVPVKEKDSDYTILPIDRTIKCITNSFTLTLPTAVGVNGKRYNLKNRGSGDITINTTSSQTIDDYSSGELIIPQNDDIEVESDGSNWIIL